MRELSDLKNRKVFNIGDAKLLHGESVCVPYEQVKEMYETCKLIGIKKTSEKYNKTNKTLMSNFYRYNFPPVGKTYSFYDAKAIADKAIKNRPSKKTLTQRQQDSLTLTLNEFNLKYKIKSTSCYHKSKRDAEKFLSNKTL